LTSQLDKRGIAFIEIKEERANQSLKSLLDTNNSKSNSNISSVLRKHFRGTIIANCKFAAETGIALIRRGDADMVSFGRLYIGNPDLAERIINNKQIYEKMDFNTFYGYELGQKGYTDYSRSI
jgi:N-ethylmaleimide reductase